VLTHGPAEVTVTECSLTLRSGIVARVTLSLASQPEHGYAAPQWVLLSATTDSADADAQAVARFLHCTAERSHYPSADDLLAHEANRVWMQYGIDREEFMGRPERGPRYVTSAEGIEYRVLDGIRAARGLVLANPPAYWARWRIFRPREGPRLACQLAPYQVREPTEEVLRTQLRHALDAGALALQGSGSDTGLFRLLMPVRRDGAPGGPWSGPGTQEHQS
jgi:hypothetical protein